jgi:hypothetical protein
MPKIVQIRPVWERWKELTQFLALSDHVLLSQAEQWRALPIANKDKVDIVREDGPYSFHTTGLTYEKILSDRHVLSSVVLLNSYALIEEHVRKLYSALEMNPNVNTSLVAQIRAGTNSVNALLMSGGIETWGTKILNDLSRTWGDVESGLVGIVETATVRNGIAHGESEVTKVMVNRVSAAGGTLPWGLGVQIRLDIALLKEYRHRLRSFSRVIEYAAEGLS